MPDPIPSSAPRRKSQRKRLLWALVAVLILAFGLGRALLARKAQQQALQTAATPSAMPIRLQPAEVLTVALQTLPQAVPVTGELQALQVAGIKAYAAGTLQDLSVREGDTVTAGQVLARVDATDSNSRLRQAQQEAEAARAQESIQQRLHSNNQALVEQGFISATTLRTSDANLAAAKAHYQSALAAADLARKAASDTVLRSPIAGQVARRYVNNGERVAVESKVLDIVDLRQLELQALLSAADSLQVRTGLSARLRLDGSPLEIAATVVRVSPLADMTTRSVPVYLRLSPLTAAQGQAPVLRPGLFLQGQIDLDSSLAPTQLAIPLDAVRNDQPQPYVQLLVQAGDGSDSVAHRTVTLGARALIAGQPWVAVQGLEPGSRVVAASAGALRAGTRVRIDTAAAPANAAPAAAAY